jgi:geranylgeranyl diphosphate synthase type II
LADDLREYLDARRRLVEDDLRHRLQVAEGTPAALREAMAYSLLAGGKRLRPLLVLLACRAAGGDETAALAAGSAVEMVHTYSLIHDDLPAMDDDDLRRGMPTSHKRFGEALAILAGDALLTLAFGVLTDAYPPATAAACCRELAAGAGPAGMVGGQVLDLAAEGRIPGAAQVGGVADLEAVHVRKTGALYRAALRMGAFAARGERPGGPEPAVLAALDRFGRCFGLAFQITDDLLDVQGDPARAGKRVNKDAARGKLTYPGLLGVAESRARADALCREAEAALAPLGPDAAPLAGLARSLLDRDH